MSTLWPFPLALESGEIQEKAAGSKLRKSTQGLGIWGIVSHKNELFVLEVEPNEVVITKAT